MKLLHFAHRGEAQTFIKNLHLKAVEGFGHIYQNDHLFLIITGEGPHDTITQLAWSVGKFSIEEIINVGIAGALRNSVEVGKIYSVRTSYGHLNDKPIFHSYSTNTESILDCITTYERVLTDDFAKTLRPFADMVDRELWAVGKVANTFNIPFFSYKLISDKAGDTTACFDLKQRAQEFSEKLFHYYCSHIDQELRDNEQEAEIKLPFHASFTQMKQITKLTKKIENSSLITEILIAPGIENAQNFIDKLEDIVNPVAKELKARIKEINRPLEDIGAQVLFDKNFENKKIKLQFEINSQTNIDNLKESLEKINFSAYEKIWNGEIDV